LGFEDIYFIVNRFDTLSNSDKERVKQYARMRLSEETSFGEKGIFFVSALDALNGKVNNDQALYDQSGMEAFEHAISVFLVEHKGRIKLSQPARELKRILNEEALFKIIPQQKSMLDSDLDELKERYALAKPKLENLEQKKDQMSKRISKLIEQMMPDIRRCANNYYQDLNANIAAWVNEYEIQTKVSVFRARQSADELVAEITEYLKDKIEEEQGIWLENTLQPLTEDKAKNILDSIEGNLENFFVELDRIKINIAGLESNDIKTIPLWQRIAAAGGGLLIGDIGVAALGGISGFSKDFAKGIALQVGAYIGLSIFGLLNPFTILLVIGASIIKAITGGGKNIEGNVKKAIIEETQKEIEASSFEAVESIMNDVKAKVSDIGDMVVRSMDTDIKEVKIQVDDIIRQMESGQENVDKRKARLAECEEQIKLLSTDLDNFIFQLIG